MAGATECLWLIARQEILPVTDDCGVSKRDSARLRPRAVTRSRTASQVGPVWGGIDGLILTPSLSTSCELSESWSSSCFVRPLLPLSAKWAVQFEKHPIAAPAFKLSSFAGLSNPRRSPHC